MLSKRKKINRQVFLYRLKKRIRNFCFKKIYEFFKKDKEETLLFLTLRNTFISFGVVFFLYVCLGCEQINSKSSLDQIFVCVAAAGPVIMGLYYSGLTFVASTTHNKLPPKVQSLLLNNSESKMYLNFLMIMSECSLGLLFVQNILYYELKKSGAVAWTLFVSAIACFIILSRNFFSYLDPESWFNVLKKRIKYQFGKIAEISKNRINKGFSTEIALDAREYVDYFKIIHSKTKKNASGKDIRLLSKNVVNVLVLYQNYKRKINPENEWYRIQAKERNLYSVEDHDFIMASETMSPPIVYVNNFFWYENEMESILLSIFEQALAEEDDEVLRKILNDMYPYLGQLVHNGFPEHSFEFIGKLWDVFEKNDTISENMKVCSLSELYEMIIQILLMSQVVYDYEMLKRRVETKKLLDCDYVFSGIFEQFLLKDVLSLSEKLTYENKIEGHVVTPECFAVEELALKLYNFYYDYFILLSEKMILFFQKRRDILKQKPKLMAVAIKKEFEYWTKWHFDLKGYSIKKELVKKMNVIPLENYLNVRKLNIEITDQKEYEEKITLYKSLILCLNNFNQLQDENIDIAGFSLNLGRKGLIEMVDNESFKKYKELIYVFVNASIEEFYYLVKCGEKDKYINPFVDLIISLGWLYILFDLLGKRDLLDYLKDVCKEMLDGLSKRQIPINFIVAIQADRRIYRYEIKQEWSDKVLEILNSSAISKDSKMYQMIKEESSEAFKWHRFDGYDVFIAFNIIDNYDVSPFKYSYSQKELYDKLKKLNVI